MEISLNSLDFIGQEIWFPIITNTDIDKIESITVNGHMVNLEDIDELTQCADIIEDVLEDYYNFNFDSVELTSCIFNPQYFNKLNKDIINVLECAYLSITKLIAESDDDEVYDDEVYGDEVYGDEVYEEDNDKNYNIDSLVQQFLREYNVFTDDIETILHKYSQWLLNK